MSPISSWLTPGLPHLHRQLRTVQEARRAHRDGQKRNEGHLQGSCVWHHSPSLGGVRPPPGIKLPSRAIPRPAGKGEERRAPIPFRTEGEGCQTSEGRTGCLHVIQASCVSSHMMLPTKHVSSMPFLAPSRPIIPYTAQRHYPWSQVAALWLARSQRLRERCAGALFGQ